ncbi:CBS domain-containing protein [Kitasatospora phosalacinea]|uniref:CBS domain-containing protein n=1 Tax=Kitasatospora phosalacinea TaxID=2065 RepID=UPI0012FEBF00|nr:CBS domain-containing protein [Kitasatospora phosalacinea]
MTTHSQPTRACLTVADAMDHCDRQIADDSTIDQANDALRGARAEYLPVRDRDGRCEGLVTRAALHFPAPCSYTEQTAISTTAHQQGPFAWPTLGLALAARVMNIRRLALWPVTDDDGYLLGVLTARRAAVVLAATPD